MCVCVLFVSVQYYERVIAADPNHADALGNLANLLVDVRGDKDAARAYYERAVKADPLNADNLVRLWFFLRCAVCTPSIE